jgi:hypothetical protein
MLSRAYTDVMKYRFLLVLLGLFGAAPATAADCSISVLPLNTTVNGELSTSDCRVNDVLGNNDNSFADKYQFTLNATDTVTISMTSSTIDSFLRVLRSDLSIVDQDDDSGNRFDAQITAQLTSGTYIILANSATSNAETGSYSITVSGSVVAVTDVDGDGVPDNVDTSIQLAPSNVLSLPIVGRNLVSPSGTTLTIPSNATAVSLNVTVVNPEAPGFVTVYPCGVERPLASNLNYAAGAIVPNGVVASLGISGSVCFYSQARLDLIVDVAGWFIGDAFSGVTPQRLVDTRNGTGGLNGQLTPANVLPIDVSGLSVMSALGVMTSVPASATAAALNVTAVNPSAPGFLTIYPCDSDRPLASNVNFTAGVVIANGVLAPLSSNGRTCVYASAGTDVVVDLAGWFAGSEFSGVLPKRFLDTRSTTRITAGGEASIQVAGASVTKSGRPSSIPSGAVAAALNVIAINPSTSGFLTVYPCGVNRPLASNVNFVAGDVVANNVLAPLGGNGRVCVFSSAEVDVVVDLSGFFTSSETSGFVPSTPTRFVDTRDGTGPKPE